MQTGTRIPGRAEAATDPDAGAAAVPLPGADGTLLAVVPIPGSRRPETILDSAAAVSLELTLEERDAIGREALG